MFRALLIGDFHIPSRAHKIPEPIISKIREERFDLILCTGDLTDQNVLELLNNLGELHVVQGNMDYLTFPRGFKVKIEKLMVGLTHGDSVHPRGDIAKLARLALKTGVNILISGHTHRPSVDEMVERGRKTLLLNPGSATGAWSGGGVSGNPSFMTLEVEGNEATVKVFELKTDRLEENTFVFKMEG